MLNTSTTLLYFKKLTGTKKFVSWKSKSLLSESVAIPITADNSLSPTFKWYRNSNFCFVFKGNYLKQDEATFTSPNIIHFSIVYELDTWSQDLDADFTLKVCLFGSVKLTKHRDPDKYSYSGYGIGSDSRSLFYIRVLIWVEMLLFLE